MPPLVVTEDRFRKGTGVRYLTNGAVRCQALSKGKIRRWREEHQDFTTPKEDLWPECQCEQPATPGMYACYWHGGPTPSKNKPRSIFDVMPVDLGEKLQALMDNEDYISRREDINLMRARKWELLEELQQAVGSEEAWGIVYEAELSLRQGKVVEAESLLKTALENTAMKKQTWDEIYRLERTIGDLTVTEVKSAKELKLMASADEVTRLINHLFELIQQAAEKYMKMDYLEGYGDQRAQADFLRHIAGEIYKSANISPITIGGLVGPGSGP